MDEFKLEYSLVSGDDFDAEVGFTLDSAKGYRACNKKIVKFVRSAIFKDYKAIALKYGDRIWTINVVGDYASVHPDIVLAAIKEVADKCAAEIFEKESVSVKSVSGTFGMLLGRLEPLYKKIDEVFDVTPVPEVPEIKPKSESSEDPEDTEDTEVENTDPVVESSEPLVDVPAGFEEVTSEDEDKLRAALQSRLAIEAAKELHEDAMDNFKPEPVAEQSVEPKPEEKTTTTDEGNGLSDDDLFDF